MDFWIWGIIILLIAALLFLNIKIEIIMVVREDELGQGLQLKIHSLIYNSHHYYEYTDPRLRLWESALIDVMEKRNGSPNHPTELNKPREDWVKRLKGFPIDNMGKQSMEPWKIFGFASQYPTNIDELEWTSQVGSRDAFYTAMGTGLCWALQGTIIGLISSRYKLGTVKTEVKPNFATPAFLSNFRCILKIRMVHIIIIKAYANAIRVRGRISGATARTAQSSH